MGINFPTAPAIGTVHPSPAVAGVPQYTWDGEKWISGTGGGAIYISDSAPAAPVGSLWWESDTGILYVRYFDGTSTQWVAVLGGPADAVRYDTAQSLSEAQKAQARKNIYAAPFDALSYSGMQINGSMDVSQAIGSTAVFASPTQTYTVDGWTCERGTGTGQIVVSQVAIAPPAFVSSLGMYSGASVPSNASGDYALLGQNIEGYRVRRLGFGTASAQSLTIGFWALSNTPGGVSVAFRNGATNRSYVTTVTMGAGAAWEYKVITIPGDTAGTWVTDNGIGLRLSFCASCGTSSLVTATPNAWQAGNTIAATGQANHLPAASMGLYITGVVVLPGIEAPSAERSPLIMRPSDQELVTCRRYFYNGVPAGVGIVYSPTIISSATSRHPVAMRSIPTILMISPLSFYDGATASSVTSVANASTNEFLRFDGMGGAGWATGRPAIAMGGVGNLNVDARL